jgi:hypothetical protein
MPKSSRLSGWSPFLLGGKGLGKGAVLAALARTVLG